MAENKLPNGVGKKIVEALRKQAEIEIQPISVDDSNSLIQDTSDSSSDFYETNITDNISLDEDFSDFSLDDNETNEINDNDINEFNNNMPAMSNEAQNSFEEAFGDSLNFEETEPSMYEKEEIFTAVQNNIKNTPQPKSYSMPANVAVLKRLIMQLPQGVTKQTGAQIIRQTMEALGISMNSVLKEAQMGQDSLTTSAKSCMATMAEYKNNIKSLEKQVQDYKKQAIALNDLISLFVMTDRH